jgi:glycerol-3-phosphate dehydrogenase
VLTLEARGQREVATARVLVNATGPWLARFAETVLRIPLPASVRLDKGSHIVVARLFEHDRGYIFQAPDRRVVFALPFERDFTLIGTTDRSFAGDPAGVAPGADEIDYLCNAANGYLRTSVAPADVLWSFAGVRALHDDGSRKAQDIARDYVLALDERGPPLLTVYGGKITTYRRLAEHALSRLAHALKPGPAWTTASHLPGGDFPHDGFEALVGEARKSWPFLADAHARRLVRAYGTRIGRILGSAKQLDDLGTAFGADLTAAEVRYLIEQEWARSADDVLWRRSKLGLRVTAQERERLAAFMDEMAAKCA